MRICVTGTPGTGKTTISKILAKKLGYKMIDLNRLIKKEKFYSKYDEKRKTYIADMKKVSKFVKSIKDKNIIIQSHLSHLLPKSAADIVIVLHCEPKELEARLKKKRWNEEKIMENVEAEIIDLIGWEAHKRHKKIFDIDTSGKKPKEIAKEINKILKENV